ncbi:MAG: hypothetical protein ACOC20_01065 [Oceanicaulis sp.]
MKRFLILIGGLAAYGCGPTNADAVAEAHERIDMEVSGEFTLDRVRVVKRDGETVVCGNIRAPLQAIPIDEAFAYRADESRLFRAAGLRGRDYERIAALCAD